MSESSRAVTTSRFTRIESILLAIGALTFVGWTVALRSEGYVDAANRLAMTLISLGTAVLFSVINRRHKKRTGRRSPVLFVATIICSLSAILWGASAYLQQRQSAVRRQQLEEQFRQQFGG